MDMRSLKWGCEIEVVHRTREQVAWAVQSVVGGEVRHVGYPSGLDPWSVTDPSGRVWQVVADASLSMAPPALRAEIVSPILEYSDLPQLQNVVRAVRRAGAHAPLLGAGLHVHVSVEAFDGAALARLAKIVYKQEELILYALGVTPERLARYTKPISEEFIRRIERAKPKTKDELNPLWYGYRNPHPQRYDQSRYTTLNLNPVWTQGTFEWRASQSSLHAGQVKATIQLCLALAAKALNARSACSRKRKYDPQSAKYDMRVFLISGLKMNGDEFKTARKHLLARMPGDAAFKYGRPKRQKHEAGTNDPATEQNQNVVAEALAGNNTQPH